MHRKTGRMTSYYTVQFHDPSGKFTGRPFLGQWFNGFGWTHEFGREMELTADQVREGLASDGEVKTLLKEGWLYTITLVTTQEIPSLEHLAR